MVDYLNSSNARDIEQYDHKDKTRLNNPQVGLVTPQTDKEAGKKNINMIRIWILPFNGPERPNI